MAVWSARRGPGPARQRPDSWLDALLWPSRSPSSFMNKAPAPPLFCTKPRNYSAGSSFLLGCSIFLGCFLLRHPLGFLHRASRYSERSLSFICLLTFLIFETWAPGGRDPRQPGLAPCPQHLERGQTRGRYLVSTWRINDKSREQKIKPGVWKIERSVDVSSLPWLHAHFPTWVALLVCDAE